MGLRQVHHWGGLFIRLTVCILVISVYSVKAQYTYTRRSCSRYGTTIRLSCYGGQTMNIVSATWGRGLTYHCRSGVYNKLCKESAAQQAKTTKLVKASCHTKTSCSIQATTAVFGDPCPGVNKYLEYKYKCMPPPTPPTIGPPKKSACNARTKADIYFMVDSSGSVGKFNYVHLLRFVNSLINNLAIGRNRVRVGLIRFSSSVQLHIPLNRYYTKTALRNAVRYIPYISGGTATSAVLQNMRTVGFTAANGARTGVPKIGILISDGSPNSMSRTLLQAATCKRNGIEIFCVAAQAPSYAARAIRQIASDPKKTHSFIVKKFPQMTMKAPPIANVICQKLAKLIPTTTPAPTTTTTTTTSK